MQTADETASLIRSGKFLALAVTRLSGGNSRPENWKPRRHDPQFLGEQGGLQSRSRVHVTELAGPDSGARIISYTAASLPGLPGDAPENGYTVLIIPALSPLHLEFASRAAEYEGVFMKPLSAGFPEFTATPGQDLAQGGRWPCRRGDREHGCGHPCPRCRLTRSALSGFSTSSARGPGMSSRSPRMASAFRIACERPTGQLRPLRPGTRTGHHPAAGGRL